MRACGRDPGNFCKHLGKFHHDLKQRPKPIDDGLDTGKSSPSGPTIQVTEFLQFTQNHGDFQQFVTLLIWGFPEIGIPDTVNVYMTMKNQLFMGKSTVNGNFP